MPKHPEPTTERPGGLDCAGCEPLLETYLDDALAAAERAACETHLAQCAACAEELALAGRIRTELHELPQMSCPPAIVHAALDHAAAHPKLGQRLAAWLFGEVRVWRPALALLAVAALGAGYLRLAVPESPAVAPGPGGYSEAEIARAEAELKLAIAYLGEISQRAGDSFGTEVGTRMVKPFSLSLTGALLPQPQDETPAPEKAGGGTNGGLS